MLQVRFCTDPDECQWLWSRFWPEECFFDLWPVRQCFALAFKRPLFFLVAEQGDAVRGLLPLSWIEEHQRFSFYPGEIWQGRTWLEQNKIPVDHIEIVGELLASIPGTADLRYLASSVVTPDGFSVMTDETGFIFLPKMYGFSFERYMLAFSGKSRKQLNRELEALTSHGVEYRYNAYRDVEQLYSLNLSGYGKYSYFFDPRFLCSFEKLVTWLAENNMLRITTVLLGGRVAAIDIGAVWHNTYTVLAGGTHVDFRGVAKMINFHHLQWACRQQLELVDFLCGDFGWKNRFHLTPRPLYEIKIATRQEMVAESIVCLEGNGD